MLLSKHRSRCLRKLPQLSDKNSVFPLQVPIQPILTSWCDLFSGDAFRAFRTQHPSAPLVSDSKTEASATGSVKVHFSEFSASHDVDAPQLL